MLPEKLELKIHSKRWAKLLGARVDLRPRNGRGLLRLVLLRGLDLREPSFAVANTNDK